MYMAWFRGRGYIFYDFAVGCQFDIRARASSIFRNTMRMFNIHGGGFWQNTVTAHRLTGVVGM